MYLQKPFLLPFTSLTRVKSRSALAFLTLSLQDQTAALSSHCVTGLCFHLLCTSSLRLSSVRRSMSVPPCHSSIISSPEAFLPDLYIRLFSSQFPCINFTSILATHSSPQIWTPAPSHLHSSYSFGSVFALLKSAVYHPGAMSVLASSSAQQRQICIRNLMFKLNVSLSFILT